MTQEHLQNIIKPPEYELEKNLRKGLLELKWTHRGFFPKRGVNWDKGMIVNKQLIRYDPRFSLYVIFGEGSRY